MQHSFIKKVFFFVLSALLSVSAKGQQTITAGAPRLKIVFFGSSVPAGEGATNNKGYTSLFSDILKSRTSESGYKWETVNISIGGDNTVKVLKRYGPDLLPQHGNYVVFALSLGNEGIHERGQPMFDQFERNMKTLIRKARSDGYIPIVTNCYTRNDFTAEDYRFIKEMNLRIHQWDVPSINLLGAIDDLSGHWMDGFWADGFHPNDAGHAEMAYAIVPSLFDALESGKPAPEWVEGQGIRLSKSKFKDKSIAFAPENIVHPFTTMVEVKTKGRGVLLRMIRATAGTGSAADAWDTATVSVNDRGQLVYTSPGSGVITGTSRVNDGRWHKIIITHYYARGATMLYSDSTLQGTLDERLHTTEMKIGGVDIPRKVTYRNWMFYRSGMNAGEVRYLARDSLLQSSLELYAPLNPETINPPGRPDRFSHPEIPGLLRNIAQSTNELYDE